MREEGVYTLKPSLTLIIYPQDENVVTTHTPREIAMSEIGPGIEVKLCWSPSKPTFSSV
jgi:hypothetical protein